MACVGVTAAIPMALYFILVTYSIFKSGDIGGPLNFVLIPLLGAVAGALCAILFCGVVAAFRASARVLVSLPLATFAVIALLTLSTVRNLDWRAAVGFALGAWVASSAAAFSCAFAITRRVARIIGRPRAESYTHLA